VEASGQEQHIAALFCDRAAGRVTEQLGRTESNDDEHTHSIARLAYNHGAYTPRML
jgi:acyl-CoA dehydrogenase family protein 9